MVVGATGFEPVVAAYQSRGLMRCFRPLSNTSSRKNDTIIYQKQEQGVKHQKTSAERSQKKRKSAGLGRFRSWTERKLPVVVLGLFHEITSGLVSGGKAPFCRHRIADIEVQAPVWRFDESVSVAGGLSDQPAALSMENWKIVIGHVSLLCCVVLLRIINPPNFIIQSSAQIIYHKIMKKSRAFRPKPEFYNQCTTHKATYPQLAP